MRILHTSDWHLGARLCDRDRSDEHKKFLDWLRETIENESIDILLISGDIFDSTNPPNSAETLYFDFLCSIRESSCSAVVITGGNHDSVSKLNSPRALLKHMSIYVNGGAGDDPEKDVISINDTDGKQIAVICAVPFLRERDIHIPKAGESWNEREKAIADGIRNYYHNALESALELKQNDDIPMIAMGHLFVTGSLSGKGERDLYVGNLGSVTMDIFDYAFSYTALGHIHKNQKIGKRDDMQYCGSPLAMDFGENGEKRVLMVDFDGPSLKNVVPVKVPLFRELFRFSGTFDEVLDQLDKFIPPDKSFWADAEILGGDAVGDISSLLNERASLKGFEFLRIKIKQISGENIISGNTSVEINDLTVEEVFIKKCEKSDIEQDEIDKLLPLHNELLYTIEHAGRSDRED
jgi:DNA repair protein SbcD/Mre11